jgi:hypothetical protein
MLYTHGTHETGEIDVRAAAGWRDTDPLHFVWQDLGWQLGRALDMTTERAIWYPFWYELDQSIAVGQVANFDFFKMPPEYVVSDGLPVFYHGDWQEKCRPLYYTHRRRILKIHHPELGPINRIDTQGLDYTFTLEGGQVILVEAEEDPGLVYGRPERVQDWRVFVEMEVA